MRPWILSEVNYGYLREHPPCEVAVLPMGATEPHNLHLPYGTDIFEAETIAGLSCEAAFKKGARVVMLPAVPYGTDTNQLAFPLAINLYPTTLTCMIGDIVESLATQRILKLLILNSHGGNDFKPVLRELYGKTTVRLFLCDWYRMAADAEKKIFSTTDDHAGEVETLLALAYFPDLVVRDGETGRLTADEGSVRPTKFEAVNQGWISITPPLASADDQLGGGESACRHRREGSRC